MRYARSFGDASRRSARRKEPRTPADAALTEPRLWSSTAWHHGPALAERCIEAVTPRNAQANNCARRSRRALQMRSSAPGTGGRWAATAAGAQRRQQAAAAGRLMVIAGVEYANPARNEGLVSRALSGLRARHRHADLRPSCVRSGRGSPTRRSSRRVEGPRKRAARGRRHAARNELQAATSGRRRRATARLLLSPRRDGDRVKPAEEGSRCAGRPGPPPPGHPRAS